MKPKERARIAMSGGTPDRVPVIPQICAPHAIRASGMPYRRTIIDCLRHPEKYDLLVPDCAVDYGADGFRVFLKPKPQEIETEGDKAYAIDPINKEPIGVVDFHGGGGVLVLPEKRHTLGENDIESTLVCPADELADSPVLQPLRSAVDKYGSEYFIIAVPGQFTLETMCHIQGIEQTLTDTIDRPDFVQRWTRRQLETSVERAIAMAKVGADALYIGETFGQFLSPRQFETLCLPYFQEFVEKVRPHGPLIYLHMCGRVTHLLELMVETGVDCIEPLDEVGGTPAAEVKKRIGNRVALMGGVNTVLLSRGSVQEVKDDCVRCIHQAGKGGGYILAACDMLPSETEPEKVRTMIRVACETGRYA